MSILFSASEIITMAIEVEKNGLNFYRAMVAKTKNEKAKTIFSFLATEETQHIKTFRELLKDLSPVAMSHTAEAEYNSYLNALTSSRIFTPDVDMDKLVKEIKDDIGAVDIAIKAEQESILFYYELREQTKAESRANIEAIIEEEKMHFAKLTQLKADLAKKQ
ncbi:hypothetical protein MNBD_GAMMA26-2385 [hydrothermal vent metagenome]|uniref:Rubrerythrin diiron-binding domain-containing protein n=1 Tax=hydrothermal vent metagenome TaxID=652676 RepID=A0A3B1BGY4_9ZZZZ